MKYATIPAISAQADVASPSKHLNLQSDSATTKRRVFARGERGALVALAVYCAAKIVRTIHINLKEVLLLEPAWLCLPGMRGSE